MKKKIKDLTQEEMENQGFMLMLHQMGKGDENGIAPCKVIHFGKSVNDFLNTEVDIPQKHILDKQEHDYLRAVVKPYKIKSITLIGGLINVCLRFRLENNMNEWFELPVFKKDTLYKGMEIDKEYSIQDLELDKEWEE